MYSELFDQINSSNTRRSNTAANEEETPPPVASIWCGLVSLEESKENNNNNNHSFLCTPESQRGELKLVYNSSQKLQFEFWDRRRNTKVSTFPVETADTTLDWATQTPRVWVWTQPQSSPAHKLFWLQDIDETKDEETLKLMQDTLKEPSKSAPVDALSSILENLNMPNETTTTTTTSAAAAPVAAAPTGTLTLADLQGAMASIQSSQADNVDLRDVLTSSAVNTICQDEAASQRLLQLLPPNQQTADGLRENLLSPSLQAALGELTQALPENYTSVLANFELPTPTEPTASPVLGLLHAILESVKEEDKKEDDEAMEDAGES